MTDENEDETRSTASGGGGGGSDEGGDITIGADGKQRKRKERLEQNRISARESRKRKKTMIEELQRTVITLSRENKDLNERNEQLRRNLMEIGTKVREATHVTKTPKQEVSIIKSIIPASRDVVVSGIDST